MCAVIVYYERKHFIIIRYIKTNVCANFAVYGMKKLYRFNEQLLKYY